MMNNFIIAVLLVLSHTGSAQEMLTLTRGTPDILVKGVKCEGTTLQNTPSFGCLCKPESDTFYEHDGKYCYSIAQILTVEGKFFS